MFAVGPGTCVLTATLPDGTAVSTEFLVLGAAFDEDTDWTPPGGTALAWDVQGSAQASLTDLLAECGLAGEVSEVSVSSDALLGVSDDSGEWLVTVYAAFAEPQYVLFRLDGLIYRITVTNSHDIRRLSLDADGGDCVAVWYVTDGAAAGLPTPLRAGYAFLDWYSGGIRFDPAAPVTQYASLTARWLTAERLTVDAMLPDDLTAIGEEAFAGMAARAVYVPDGCESIGSGAFRNCAELCQIRIPAGCTVAEDAFDGCAQLIIFGTPGSAAQAYAAAHENCAFAAE